MAPKRAPSRHHLRQRERLLAITRHLAVAQGYGSIRLADVAAEAGFSTPAVYAYFDGRDALLAAAVRDVVATVVDDLAGTDDPDRSTRDRLRARFESWAGRLTGPDAVHLQALHRAILDAPAETALQQAVDEGVGLVRGWYASVLRTGIERGEVRSDLDVDAMVDLLNACFLGIELGSTHGMVRRSAATLMGSLLDMVIDHLESPARRRPPKRRAG